MVKAQGTSRSPAERLDDILSSTIPTKSPGRRREDVGKRREGKRDEERSRKSDGNKFCLLELPEYVNEGVRLAANLKSEVYCNTLFPTYIMVIQFFSCSYVTKKQD